MRSPRLVMGVALAAVAGVTAIVVVLVLGFGGKTTPASAPTPGQQIQATAALNPRAALFGDTVTARVDVTFDRTQFDPRYVHVTTSFAPWSKVGVPIVTRENAGSTTFLRTTYVLRCLEIRCVPSHEMAKYDFHPARVIYEAPVGEGTERLAIDARWPTLVLHSRLDFSQNDQRDPLAAPWRADIVSLPAVSYRVSPGATIGLLSASGAALVLLAGALAYRARPRRGPPPPPPPPPPAPRLAPLEQALLLLETSASVDGVEERRRSLELVADELERFGDEGLERAARRLAWSEEDPAPEATRDLAARVRTLLEEHLSGHPA